jgi:NAD(P)-dependent dehydrogenase (short-subunit alcohol dehydrogenase family)
MTESHGVTIVTGGASGLGEATVRLLVQRGRRVVVADIQDDRGRTLAEDLGSLATYRHVDVLQEEDVAGVVDEAVEAWGALDGMVNNAGIVGAIGPVDTTPVQEWDYTIGVLLRSAFLGIKHASRVMKPQQRGVIVSTTSIAAFRGGIGPHAYSAAKAGVVGLTRSAAAELGAHGVRVNAVAPGHIATPMVAASWLGDADEVDAAYEAILAKSPLKDRAGRAVDVAEAITWLLSESAGYVSGEVLTVDGGLLGGSPPVEQSSSDRYADRYAKRGAFLREGGARGLPDRG